MSDSSFLFWPCLSRESKLWTYSCVSLTVPLQQSFETVYPPDLIAFFPRFKIFLSWLSMLLKILELIMTSVRPDSSKTFLTILWRRECPLSSSMTGSPVFPLLGGFATVYIKYLRKKKKYIEPEILQNSTKCQFIIFLYSDSWNKNFNFSIRPSIQNQGPLISK